MRKEETEESGNAEGNRTIIITIEETGTTGGKDETDMFGRETGNFASREDREGTAL